MHYDAAADAAAAAAWMFADFSPLSLLSFLFCSTFFFCTLRLWWLPASVWSRHTAASKPLLFPSTQPERARKIFFWLNRKETIGSEENSSQKISKTFNTGRIIRQTFVASSFTTRRKKMREKESRFLPISDFGCFGIMKKDDDESLIFWQQLKDVCAFCLLPLVP